MSNKFNFDSGSPTAQNVGIFNPEGAGRPIIPTNYDLASRKIYVGGIAQHHTDHEVAGFLGEML